jgi:hypothetical protein
MIQLIIDCKGVAFNMVMGDTIALFKVRWLYFYQMQVSDLGLARGLYLGVSEGHECKHLGNSEACSGFGREIEVVVLLGRRA